jgi:hypothetical protein
MSPASSTAAQAAKRAKRKPDFLLLLAQARTRFRALLEGMGS